MATDFLGETINGWILDGGEGEKFECGGGVMIPLRLGDFIISLPATADGSCSG